MKWSVDASEVSRGRESPLPQRSERLICVKLAAIGARMTLKTRFSGM